MIGEEVSVRSMTLEDLERVMEIERLCFSLPWPESGYRHDLTKNPHARLWVAEILGEDGCRIIVGVTVVWLVVDEIHIGTLGVHPGFRRRGVAAKLLGHALRQARREGMQQAFLEVRRSNLAAQSLYQRFGFEIVGVRRRYYQDNGEDALMMTRVGLDEE